MAAQSLCADTKLHLLSDDSRHEAVYTMDYEAPCLGSPLDADASFSDMSISEGTNSHDGDHGANEAETSLRAKVEGGNENEDDEVVEEDDDPNWEDNVEYPEEDGDEINMEAYEVESSNSTGVEKIEQAGVIHLVHGWTQRGHPNDVSPISKITVLCS